MHCKLPLWIAIMNVYPVSFRVNCFFRPVLHSTSLNAPAGQPRATVCFIKQIRLIFARNWGNSRAPVAIETFRHTEIWAEAELHGRACAQARFSTACHLDRKGSAPRLRPSRTPRAVSAHAFSRLQTTHPNERTRRSKCQ